jgi:hypothetical protein
MGGNHYAMTSVCIRADLLRRAESVLKRSSVHLYEQIMVFLYETYGIFALNHLGRRLQLGVPTCS